MDVAVVARANLFMHCTGVDICLEVIPIPLPLLKDREAFVLARMTAGFRDWEGGMFRDKRRVKTGERYMDGLLC